MLNRLNDVRKDIRTSAAKFRQAKSLEANHDQATNLVTGALNSMMCKANKNIELSTAKYKDEIAACPAHLRGEFIKLLLRNKAILIIDTFDDIVTV